MNINREYISKNNTYAGKNQPGLIVIHETDNWAVGAGAKRHAQAQFNGHLSTSVHYYCGSDGIYQAAEHADGTYSVGTEYGGNHSVTNATNRNTINIEICVNKDGDYNTARKNAIELVRYLIQATGIPAGKVIRHYDAKGKYCPRKMLDTPSLWDDFKAQIGQAASQKAEAVQPEPEKATSLYRVGTNWKSGICQGQIGAFQIKENAIATCKAGYHVFNAGGNIIHSGPGVGTAQTGTAPVYSQKDFVVDVQKCTGSKPDGIPGDETIGNTITVSKTKNKNHAVTTPLERYLKALGYYTGAIEADQGKTPCFGSGMEVAANAYQKEVLGMKNPDGEITKDKKMWRSMFGMI